MRSIQVFITVGIFIVLGLRPAVAQVSQRALRAVQAILETEGEVFIVIDAWNERLKRTCTSEDLLQNRLFPGTDTAKITYLNVTEYFCNPYVLQTRYTYEFHPSDIDPASAVLIQKNYQYSGKLTQGEPYWFEIQLPVRGNQPRIRRRDLENREITYVPSVTLLFQTQAAAERAMTQLRSQPTPPDSSKE